MSKITSKTALPFIILVAFSILALTVPSATNFDDGKYNGADIAWMIVATALVFLMTPGLAFFYGGMVNRKNVISTMIKSLIAAGLVSVLWIVVGYSLCFGESWHGLIGNPMTHFMFKGVNSGKPWVLCPTVPLNLICAFNSCLPSYSGIGCGCSSERIKFSAYVLFIPLFSMLVYPPLAHWSWHPDGILAKMGALDFAGGTVVHISAGCAALAGAMVLKQRRSHIMHKEIPPANIPYVLIGTGLLWFGWFGFNAGSAGAASALSVSAFATTNTAAAGLSWMFLRVIKENSVLGSVLVRSLGW
jgi:Amt family ammonium transporter